jgi:hypothetical protein
MKKLFILCSLVAVFTGCKKDKFKTEPQVEIKSLSPKDVFNKDVFTLKTIIRDQEGDLQDSVRLVRKFFTGSTLLRVDTLPFYIKDFSFPDKQTIELDAQFSYGDLSRSDCIFLNLLAQDQDFAVGVIVRDRAGHKSTYVESEKIRLHKF